ncbi:tetratricopeptide repeat protein [Deinococcus sp. QL22]|uniref:tetratricopeptide repeat protein n=1 Tax=Deinococcus sp. QL22 TaxID=2939437 RepID=UPI002017629A|nr:tetratricopeptide repeat protein [Deinococcus sp. QL22]UQN06495.1 tetratricopeptide repeat protein [Deinococcus sp. QL22]
MPISQADAEATLAQLPPLLLGALLPLALEETWHPVRSLALAPDLPDGWWNAVVDHLPLVPADDNTAQVPSALREALARRLSTERPRLYRDLIIRQSEEAMRTGDIQHALILRHDIGEGKEACQQLEAWMNQAVRAGSYKLVQATFEALPTHLTNARTTAAYWTAVIADTNRERARTARQEAHHAYDGGERNPRLMYALSYALQLDGQYDPALHFVDEALMAGTSGRDTLQLLQMRGMLLSYLQRLDEHLETSLQLLTEAQGQGDLYFTAIAHMTVGYAREDMGNLGLAEDHYHKAIALYTRISQWHQLATLLNNYAQSLAAAGRPAEAMYRLDEATRLPTLVLRHRAWFAFTAAIIHHQYGMHAEALASTRRAAELLHEAHLGGDAIKVLLLEAERLVLNGEQALAELRYREARTLSSDSPTDIAQLDFTAGVLAYGKQAWQEAETYFLRACSDDVTRWDRARSHLYLIAINLQCGGHPDVLALEQSLAALGTDAPFLTDAPLLRKTLTWLGEQPGWHDRLSHIFKGAARAATVPLRLELFGPIEIYSKAEPLHFPLRRSAELLVFLALNGSSSRQQILAALWEGELDSKTVDHFKKVLRGVRDTLHPLLPEGTDPVVVASRQYTLNPLLDISTAWLPGDLFPAPWVRLSGSINVRGDFAADAQGPWADDVRMGLHDRLLNHLHAREREGDPTVGQALKVVQGLM